MLSGVSSSWDGNGINPFMDYVHNGDESVALYGLELNIFYTMLVSFKGRGMDLNFDYVGMSEVVRTRIIHLHITSNWCWGVFHIGMMVDCICQESSSYGPIHNIGTT